MIREIIAKVVNGHNLTVDEMTQVMESITEGEATQGQIAAFLVGLRAKGEVTDEIVAAARVMRAKSVPLPIGNSEICLDRDEINVDLETVASTSRTGGDGTNTFNVSTTTAFVVAGCGLKVAKHGHLSASGNCGSANVLQALGVPLELTPRHVGECVEQLGIGFLYQSYLDGFMRYILDLRRDIGVRTIFNLLGPLTNPGQAPVQLLGVYREDMTDLLAEVLKKLGCRSGFAVFGEGCYDEFSITGPSRVTRLLNDETTTFTLVPEDVGLKRAALEDIRGGNASENATITLSILQGEKGARRDMVLLNAAAVLVAAAKADTLEAGIELAAESIDSGQARKKLQDLVALGTSKVVGAPLTQSGWGWSSPDSAS
ncbi:MAG: anthranilate phosphoribosyltransferase [Thermodesulfobacteriota bacterium]